MHGLSSDSVLASVQGRSSDGSKEFMKEVRIGASVHIYASNRGPVLVANSSPALMLKAGNLAKVLEVFSRSARICLKPASCAFGYVPWCVVVCLATQSDGDSCCLGCHHVPSEPVAAPNPCLSGTCSAADQDVASGSRLTTLHNIFVTGLDSRYKPSTVYVRHVCAVEE